MQLEKENKKKDEELQSLKEKITVEKRAEIDRKEVAVKNVVSSIKRLKCEKCRKVFNGPNVLKVHMEIHHEASSEILRQKEETDSEEETEKNEGLLKCDKCRKTFTEQSILEAHIELRHRETSP